MDKATGVASVLGPGLGTARHVMAFNSFDELILIQTNDVYEISTSDGTASFQKTLPFDPGSSGADFDENDLLWNSTTLGSVQDSLIRVTNIGANSSSIIDTDVEYLNGLAWSAATMVPEPSSLFVVGILSVCSIATGRRRAV